MKDVGFKRARVTILVPGVIVSASQNAAGMELSPSFIGDNPCHFQTIDAGLSQDHRYDNNFTVPEDITLGNSAAEATGLSQGCRYDNNFTVVRCYKYGQATTHWDKLLHRVQRGMGNPCPLVLIGLPAAMVRFDAAKVDVLDDDEAAPLSP